MAKKRSPWASYHKKQQAANSKYLDIWYSQRHPCVCGHPQGFHRDTDEGENTGKCEPADCDCTAFDEDLFAAAQIAAGVLPTTTTDATEPDHGEDDPLTRAMRDQEQREVSAEEAWNWAVQADRPRPTGKPRPGTLDDPAAIDALRQLGGSPDDLTG